MVANPYGHSASAKNDQLDKDHEDTAMIDPIC